MATPLVARVHYTVVAQRGATDPRIAHPAQPCAMLRQGSAGFE
jgi:hypothetical protein